MYKILFSRAAQKDASNIKRAQLENKCKTILRIIAQDPFTKIPPFEKLVGDLQCFYSRRINLQHRLVYEVDEVNKIIKILRMWSHYD